MPATVIRACSAQAARSRDYPMYLLDLHAMAAIVADVEAWWHLKAEEAARLLVERAIAGQKSSQTAQDWLSAASGAPPLPRSRNAA